MRYLVLRELRDQAAFQLQLIYVVLRTYFKGASVVQFRYPHSFDSQMKTAEVSPILH